MFSIFNHIEPVYFEALGILGFTLYVLSYVLLTMGKVSSDNAPYFVMNLCAASLVLIGLTASFNLASAMIQIFWVAVSIFAIATRLSRRAV